VTSVFSLPLVILWEGTSFVVFLPPPSSHLQNVANVPVKRLSVNHISSKIVDKVSPQTQKTSFLCQKLTTSVQNTASEEIRSSLAQGMVQGIMVSTSCSFVVSFLSPVSSQSALPRCPQSISLSAEYRAVRAYVRSCIFLIRICSDLPPPSSSLNGSLH
jgi:hypothetical protein